MFKKRPFALALFAIVCAVATACSSSGGGSTSSSTPPSSAGAGSATGASTSAGPDTSALDKILAPVATKPAELQVTTPLSKVPPTGIKVVALDDGLAQEKAYYDGMAAAAKVLGWSFSTQSIDDNNLQTVISGATSAINAGAKVVVMVSELQSTIDKFLPLAVSHNAVILDTISSNTAHAGQLIAASAGHEFNVQGGYAAAAILKDAAVNNRTAHVGETFIPQFATALTPEEDGFKQVLSAQCSSCSVDRMNISFADVQSGAYIKDITSYLQTHPNVNYIFTQGGNLVQGVVPALKQAGISVPKIVGSDPNAASFSDLKSGANQEWLTVPQAVLGWVWTDELARYFVGDDYNVWNTTAYDPQWLITPQNVSESGDTNDVEFPDGYQGIFSKLWGVPS